jgi:hypothetical protein
VSLPVADDNWVKAIYSQLAGHPPSGGQEAATDQALSGAEIAARRGIAAALTASTEFRQRLVTMAYNNYLKQPPSPSQLANGVALLGQPSSGAGTLSRDEQLIGNLLASPTYFYLQTDPANNLHDNTAWIASLYNNLQIPFDPAGASTTLSNLFAAYAPQRLAVINSILTGVEYRTNIVKKAYGFIGSTGRAPSGAELSAGLGALAAGTTDEQLIASVMGSPEYFQRAHEIVGNTQVNNTTFVQALYIQLFPWLTVDAGTIQSWVNKLNANQITRGAVAYALITSPLYRFEPTHGLVNQGYLKYLGRSASPAEISAWRTAFGNGVTDEAFIANLLLSAEYFLRTHTFP